MRFRSVVPALLLIALGTAAAAQNTQSASGASSEGRQAQLLQIQGYIEAGNLAAAEAAGRTALQRFPRDGGIENLLGVVQVQQGNVSAAQVYFADAVAHSPKLVPAYLNLARLLLTTPGAAAEAQQKAYGLYQQVLRLDPANAEARLEAATIATNRGEYASSLALLGPLSSDMRGRLEVADLLLADNAALGRRAQANQAAETLIASPRFSDPDLALVLPGLRQGRRADLMDRLLSAMSARTPLDAPDLRLLGLAKEAEGDAAAAKMLLEQAYAAQPSDPAPLIDLARIAEAQGDGKAALGYLAHARDLAPKDAALAYDFGLTCYRLNLLGEARKAFADAYALAPENATYALTLGKITAASQDPLKAEPFLAKYHQLRPADAQGLLLLGLIYYRVKDYAAAATWLTQAAQHPQTAAAAHLYLGIGLREQGELAEAQRELQLSEALDTNVPEVHAQLGMIALQKKQFSQAERELDLATKTDPDSYSGNFGLMQLYAQTHDPRRPAQSQRFEQIKEHNEESNREAMRVIEIVPNSSTPEKQP